MLKVIEGVEVETDLLSPEVIQDDLFRLQKTLLESWSFQMFFDQLQANCQKGIDEENAKILTSSTEEIEKITKTCDAIRLQMDGNSAKLRVAKENVSYLTRKIRAYQAILKND